MHRFLVFAGRPTSPANVEAGQDEARKLLPSAGGLGTKLVAIRGKRRPLPIYVLDFEQLSPRRRNRQATRYLLFKQHTPRKDDGHSEAFLQEINKNNGILPNADFRCKAAYAQGTLELVSVRQLGIDRYALIGYDH
jgi:hypothetical protein